MAGSETQQQPQVTVRNIPQESYNQNVAAGAAQPGGGSAGTPAAGGGIKGHLQRNWPLYTIGLGIATIAVIIYVNNQQNNNTLGNITGGTSGTMGMSGDQLYGSQLDADYQQLMSFQNQQIGLLQTIQNKLTNPSSNPPSGGSSGGTSSYNPANVTPAAKGTKGLSNNFWVYTTKSGDTIGSITSNVAKWGNHFGDFENYRNNMDILHAYGIDTSNPNAQLPAGMRISV